jgi:hypothetical protein
MMLSFFKGPGNPVQVEDRGAEVCAANLAVLFLFFATLAIYY